MSFRIVVDAAACCGYGVCAEICPQLYKLDANGIVYVEGDGAVPDDLLALARDGADACPQAALTLVAA